MYLNFCTKIIGKHQIHLPQVDSTNLFLKKNLAILPNGFLAYTSNQTNGYGSKNRTWQNFKNKNLAFSILLKNIPKTFLEQSTQFTAISLIQCLKSFNIPNTSIKWFNDILISNKKIAGILGESQITTKSIHLILGVGINLLQTQNDFQKFNLKQAGSVLSQTGKTIKSSVFLKRFIKIFECFLFSCLNNSLPTFKLYNQNCCSIGKNVQILNSTNGSTFFCKTTQINQNGQLNVTLKNNINMHLDPSKFSIIKFLN